MVHNTTLRFFLIYLFVLLSTAAGVGCGGSSGSAASLNGIWDVTVHLGANGCPNDVPILENLSYTHTITQSPNVGLPERVIIVDQDGATFDSNDTATLNSFIATGAGHTLEPFITGANCIETIIWSYFEIRGNSYSDNVGRNSIIECASRAGPISCNVYYLGTAVKR